MNKAILLIFTFCLSSYMVKSQSTTVECENQHGNTRLKGSCSEVSECTGAAFIPAINCPIKDQICCVAETAKSTSTNSIINLALFLKIAGNTARNKALYPFFAESMAASNINNENKAAAYLSQMIGETNYFTEMEAIKAEPDNFVELGNNQPGDGAKYRGRGGILLRGKNNYELASKIKGINMDFIQNPERATFPSYAFKIAGWFWNTNAVVILNKTHSEKRDLNTLADGNYHSFTMMTHSLTSNLESLKRRTEINEMVLDELKYPPLRRGEGIECEYEGETGYAVPICLRGFERTYCGCEGTYGKRSCPYGFLNERECRGSNIIECCIERCASSLDLVILTDSSGSIGTRDYKIQMEFVVTLVDSLEVGINATRIALIDFSTDAKLIFDFNSNQDKEIIKKQILDMIPNYQGGNTNTAAALRMANDRALQEIYGMRAVTTGIPKIVMVITDGASNVNPSQTLPEAKKIKDRGFSIISVGIGKINLAELQGMASTPNDVYKVEDFNQVRAIVTSLSRTTCLQPAEVIVEQEIVASVPKNSYLYYKYPLLVKGQENVPKQNQTYLEDFTLQLSLVSG